MYEPQQRSPGSHRQQQQQHRDLTRQTSRQFDAYGTVPSSLYQMDDNSRYDVAPRNYDRLNATMHNYPHNDFGGSGWNTGNNGSFGANQNLAPFTGRMKGNQPRGRLPTDWMQTSQQPPVPPFPGLGHNVPSPLTGGQSGYGLRQDHIPEDPDELIPTAIVIKNIPFAVKKEALLQLMTEMRLPLPYAFNYHFDGGVFRGLAFANFTTSDETAAVIDNLNHFELHGRKLRVEYKKMLPLAERERIEREKRERRGQLQEQHMPQPGPTLNQQPSIGSLHSHGQAPATSPSPVQGRSVKPGRTLMARQPPSLAPSTNEGAEYDLNDPEVLRYYTQLLLFREDHQRTEMVFPATLHPTERRVIHTIAHEFGLMHLSKGVGDQRQVYVHKLNAPNTSPPIPQGYDPNRRALNRAATTDFSDVRAADGFYGTLGRQGSGYLGFQDSSGGLAAAQNLRGAKSYADLRSYTPSPVPSTASFPANVRNAFEYGQGSASTNPSNTPTNTTMNGRDEMLINSMNGMNLGNGFNTQSSPKRGLRGMMSWDRESNPGPIGGHRSMSTNYEEQSRDRSSAHPSRQPRGPLGNNSGFSRPRQNGHHGRGSDELSQQSGVEIIVEH
ncbi:hypothetical protein EJ05DRAFT_488002 [Pseudovirgaria hyperparasitica]|uniref:R3H domain protein n=1 Tax=Pseudovirgaria hyperparasitica TaxID=470096 RepID=A0A6A6W115_9PEZI|nr:uncharacterized protein EJ05DRAFT_488002 [Pseudovirgaria hyperparasitica]KAF2756215.1 hypothetical protein EJ05DRAFT_488002 [Pseudovirgaria hyperparasitica]